MLKRVNSHLKVRKSNFLQIQGLTSTCRSKSLTQINCLENKKDEKLETNVSLDLQNQKTSNYKTFLSPEHQHLDESEQVPQSKNKSSSSISKTNFHNQYSSLPDNSTDSEYTNLNSTSYFSTSTTTSITSPSNNTDCLIVPVKAKLVASFASNLNEPKNSFSKEAAKSSTNKYSKAFFQSINSSETIESDASLKKFTYKKNIISGISNEDQIEDTNDTNVIKQFSSTSLNKTHLTHHFNNYSTRRTGGIFSKPFKNEREKMDQLTELLNHFDALGIPCITEEMKLNKTFHSSKTSSFKPLNQQTNSKQSNSTNSINSLSNLNTSIENIQPTLLTSASSSSSNLQQNLNQQSTVQPNSNLTNLTNLIESNSIVSSTYLNKSIINNLHTTLKNSKSTCGILSSNAINREATFITNENLNENLNYKNCSSCSSNLNEFPINDDKILYLETNWTDFVKENEQLNKKLHNQQDAIWELITTEVSYIQRLKVIKNLFQNCLISLQLENLLTDIDTDKIFRNINELLNSNLNFWSNYLLKMLNHSRLTGSSLNPILMANGFYHFDELFKPYRSYCVEHLLSIQYVKKKQKENELFKTYVAWCETRKDCERLHMVDLLVNPMQRLTKYSLLLKVILTKTDNEEQLSCLRKMNEIVEKFVVSVDTCLCKRNQLEKLNLISKRIESYDVIESNNDEVEKIIKEYRELNLFQQMINCKKDEVRQLLLEASGLKLKDAYSSSKIDVHCLLFTDILLLCKQVNKKTSDRLKIIRQPFMVQRLKAHELKDQSGLVMIYLNELNAASSFFILYTTDTRIWLQKLSDAQKLYYNLTQQKQSQTEKTEIQPKSFLQNTKSTEDEYYEDYYNPEAKLQHLQSNNLQSILGSSGHQTNFCYSFGTLSSAKSSSRSSLIKSQSNSIDQSEVSGYESNILLAAPSSTPNPFYTEHQYIICTNCAKQLNNSQSVSNLRYKNQPSTEKQSFSSNTFESMSTLESINQCVQFNLQQNDTLNKDIDIKTYDKQKCLKTFPNQHQKKCNHFLKANNLHPTNNLTTSDANSQQRAISFELGELRNPSLVVDDIDLSRSHSMENRCPVFVTITSPRPERRAFLLKGAGGTAFSSLSTNNPISTETHLSTTFVNTISSSLKSAETSSSICTDSKLQQHFHCINCKNLINISNYNNYNNLNINLEPKNTICTSLKELEKNSSNKNLQLNVETVDYLRKNNQSNLNINSLRQVRSLDQANLQDSKIENQNLIQVPVPSINKNITKINIEDHQEKHIQNEFKSTSKILNNLSTRLNSSITTKPSTFINKPPLIKTKNVILSSTSNLISKLTKSAPTSGEVSPQNISFESDQGEFTISDPDDYASSASAEHNLEKQTKFKNSKNLNTKTLIKTEQSNLPKQSFFKTQANISSPSYTSTTFNASNNSNASNTNIYSIKNIPSFVIESQEEIEKENSLIKFKSLSIEDRIVQNENLTQSESESKTLDLNKRKLTPPPITPRQPQKVNKSQNKTPVVRQPGVIKTEDKY